MEKLPRILDEKEIKQLEEAERVKIMPYGSDKRFFAVIDGVDLYYHTQENNRDYTILKRNYLESSIHSSQ
jgi:hypothetical protein